MKRRLRGKEQLAHGEENDYAAELCDAALEDGVYFGYVTTKPHILTIMQHMQRPISFTEPRGTLQSFLYKHGLQPPHKGAAFFSFINCHTLIVNLWLTCK